MTPQPLPFYIKLSHSLISIALLLVLLYLGQHILVPLAFACLLSVLLMGFCNMLERYGMRRGFAAILAVLMAILGGLVILYLISSQLTRFRDDLPAVADQLVTALQGLQDWAQKKFHLSTESMNEMLHSFTTKTLTTTTSLVGNTVATLSGTLLWMVLVPIYTFLLLLYRNLVKRFFISSFSEVHTPVVQGVLTKTKAVIRGYVTGLFIEMLIVAIMNCTGFFILGVKYALLLGVIAALLNVIPYLGIFIACLLSVLITFTTNTPATVLGVAIVLVVVHLLDSNILLPRVVGSKVKINALVTILGVIIGSALWGIPGMFLAIPFIAILKVIFDAVGSLQPWGMLLGDDTTHEAGAKRRMLLFWKKRKKANAASEKE